MSDCFAMNDLVTFHSFSGSARLICLAHQHLLIVKIHHGLLTWNKPNNVGTAFQSSCCAMCMPKHFRCPLLNDMSLSLIADNLRLNVSSDSISPWSQRPGLKLSASAPNTFSSKCVVQGDTPTIVPAGSLWPYAGRTNQPRAKVCIIKPRLLRAGNHLPYGVSIP